MQQDASGNQSLVAAANGFVTERNAKAFTSAGDGNWNSLATWTDGADYPRLSADTATISAGNEVTIPTGLTVAVGAIALNAGTNTTTNRTKLINAGTLNLGAALSLPTISTLALSAGGMLDLMSFTITAAATDVNYDFAGSSGSHVTVRSTGGRGAFAITGTSVVVATWDYVDVSGLADSSFARSHTSAVMQHYDHCTFTDMENVIIDATTTSVNAGFEFTNNDIRSPHTPSGTDYQPQIVGGGQALGTRVRKFSDNTFSSSSTLGKFSITGIPALTEFTRNVVNRYQMNIPNAGAGVQTLTGNFWSNTSGDDGAFALGGDVWQTRTGEYFYYEGGNHVFQNTTSAVIATGCVFEVPQNTTYRGMNWFLPGAALSFTVQNNIWLGAGTPMSVLAALAPTIDFSNNTWYGDNFQTVSPNFGDFAIFETEQAAALSGTFNYYNNLAVVWNTNPGGAGAVTNPHISLRNAVGTQITSANFNGNAGYDNAGAYDVLAILGYWENRGGGQIVGLGINDITGDPLFLDKTRALATWDSSLGGPGTAAHAISEMLKLNGYGGTFNAAYGLAALLTYVKAGFQPTGLGLVLYNGTGVAGANIGFR